MITLREFILKRRQDFSYGVEELADLLGDIEAAGKMVNQQVNKAGLTNILGKTGTSNVSGDEVKKLDVYANEEFINALEVGGQCCGIGSEENEKFIPVNNDTSKSAGNRLLDTQYIVLIDPLDGSSNIDVNVSIGTIFSIYRKISSKQEVALEDFLQKGSQQVAAGYIIYGSSTMLVYSTGKGVNGFTLDPSVDEFYLSHENMRIPQNGKIYSINQGNFVQFPEGVKQYVQYCQQEDKNTNRPFSLRYIGSMVADLHRNLISGGIFIYPATKSSPNGKLRLLYECNPLSFIVEQAGGRATDGFQRILDIEPKELHQRTPIFIGSKQMVEKAEECMKK